tara:strand:+ start:124 stop:534 length:411 start_codon:yes stop_codon:yes gene_type:complete
MINQTKEETLKQLEDCKEHIFIPYYRVEYGDWNREIFQLTEYNLLQLKINDIYNNIKDYKGLQIEIILQLEDDYHRTISIIQREEEDEEEDFTTDPCDKCKKIITDEDDRHFPENWTNKYPMGTMFCSDCLNEEEE